MTGNPTKRKNGKALTQTVKRKGPGGPFLSARVDKVYSHEPRPSASCCIAYSEPLPLAGFGAGFG